MTEQSEVFVAFDTSKLRNAVAIAEGGLHDHRVDNLSCIARREAGLWHPRGLTWDIRA